MSHECCDPYGYGGIPPVGGLAGYGVPGYGAPGYGGLGFGAGGWGIWIIVIIAIFFLFFNERRRVPDVI